MEYDILSLTDPHPAGFAEGGCPMKLLKNLFAALGALIAFAAAALAVLVVLDDRRRHRYLQVEPASEV